MSRQLSCPGFLRRGGGCREVPRPSPAILVPHSHHPRAVFASGEPLWILQGLVTCLAHGCAVRRAAERPLRNAAQSCTALLL